MHSRPHYHALLFNIDFRDKRQHALRNGNITYRSEELERLWPYGFSEIGEVTFQSAAYVARYVFKKFKGKEEDKENHYLKIDKETGEAFKVNPEFVVMSLNPGIGKPWFDKYILDTGKDFITHKGEKYPLPRYYDKLLERIDPEEYQRRKESRIEQAKKNWDTEERLESKEKVKVAQTKLLNRNYEDD